MISAEQLKRLPTVILKFSGLQYYTSEFLVSGLELIERALHELEEEELMKLLDEYEMTSIVYAVRAEMDKMRRQHLQIFDARAGSIELHGTVGVVALWVLQVTVGESMKEAYKKSDIHQHLSRIFSSDVADFAKKLNSNIEKTLRSSKRNSAFIIALSRVEIGVTNYSNHNQKNTVVVSLNAEVNYPKIPPEFLRPRRPQV